MNPPERDRCALTSRELEVARLVRLGLTNAQIAERLVIAEATVASHIHSALKKLGLRNRVQLVGWYVEHAPQPPPAG
jgi:DNA-binding NarL/FixJ family response regulator